MIEKFGPNSSPEERLGWAKKEKESIIKEADMLNAGGEYHVSEEGGVSFQYSDKQIEERNEKLKEERIKQFLLVPENEFELDSEGMELDPEVVIILKRLIPLNFQLYLDKIEITAEGEYIFTPSKKALERVNLMLPPAVTSYEELLGNNERCEYPPITIDNSLSLEEAIKTARIIETHEKTSRFSFETSETGQFKPVLIRFGLSKTWIELQEELEKMNLRPATLRELLAFAAEFSDDQNIKKYIIHAAGSKITYDSLQHTPYVRLSSKEETPFEKYKYLGQKTNYGGVSAYASNFTDAVLCTYK